MECEARHKRLGSEGRRWRDLEWLQQARPAPGGDGGLDARITRSAHDDDAAWELGDRRSGRFRDGLDGDVGLVETVVAADGN